VATGVAIVATMAQIGYLRYKTGKVEPMQWVSLGVIVLFGGATIIAHNETFIKWKPTVLYWLMGGALLAGQLICSQEPAQEPDGRQMELPDAAWRVMNWSWTGFFAVMGVINLWVAYNFDTDTWVNFKLFGGYRPDAGLWWARPFIWAATSNPETNPPKRTGGSHDPGHRRRRRTCTPGWWTGCSPPSWKCWTKARAMRAHAGADGTGFRHPFPGADCFTFVYRPDPRGEASPCV
jgi:intracellular septation protein